MANPTNKTNAAQPADAGTAGGTGRAKSGPTGAQPGRSAQQPAAATRPRAAQGKDSRKEQGARADLGTLRITYIKSVIGYSQRQRDTIRGLGLRKLHQTVEHRATPEIRGMVNKVSHLVRVEEVAG